MRHLDVGANGVPPKGAAERLGHSDPTLVTNLYSHVTPTMQRDAAAKLGDALFGPTTGEEVARRRVTVELDSELLDGARAAAHRLGIPEDELFEQDRPVTRAGRVHYGRAGSTMDEPAIRSAPRASRGR
ncbi:MAG: hypothetical protein NVS3B21_22140 [Acidimicrobiales bacterium]